MRKPSFAGSRSFSVLAILLACLLASLPAAAKPRPAVALVHLFLPPDDERSTALMGWVRSLDHARDMLESRRIPTVVSAVPPDDPAELHDLIALKPEVLISTSCSTPSSATRRNAIPIRSFSPARTKRRKAP